jgi:hypothetical protein
MKFAAIFTGGDLQLILTPETEQERALCRLVPKASGALVGPFNGLYECRGGWYRQSEETNSLMVRITNPAPANE